MEPGTKPSLFSRISSLLLDLRPKLLSVWRSVISLLSKLHAPNQDYGKPVSPQDNTRKESERGQFQPAIIAQVAPTPPKTYQADGGKDNTPLWGKIAEWSIAGATVGLLVVTIVYTFLTNKISKTAEYQERTGLMPYIDLSKATVFTTPLDKDQDSIVLLSLTNAGKTPAKNVRVVACLGIRKKGKRLCPPLEDSFPKNGSTFPSNSPQIIIKTVTVSPSDREAYRSGNARLYVWGGVLYWDFWFATLGPKGSVRSSIFCRSFGIKNDSIRAMNAAPESTAVMQPCTAEEWPFNDLFDCDSGVYSPIKGKCVAVTPNTPHPLTYEECNQQDKSCPVTPPD